MNERSLTSLALTALDRRLGACPVVRLAVGPDSKLWIEGGSNLHDWSCKASAIDATIDVDESIAQGDHRLPDSR